MALTFEALTGLLALNVGPWMSGVKQAQGGIGQLRQSVAVGMRAMGDTARQAALAIGGIATALTAVAAVSVREATTYEQALARLKSKLSARITDTKLLDAAVGKLSAQVTQLAKDTEFNPTQILQGMTALIKSGMTVEETQKAIRATLDGSSASMIEVGQSASIVADGLKEMGLQASDSERYVDVLTKASTLSNTEFTELAMAFKAAGPMAHSLGLSLEETASYIMTFANNGIKGEEAGMRLKEIWGQMVLTGGVAEKTLNGMGVAFRDQNNQLLPLNKVLDNFNRRANELGPTFNRTAAAMKAFQLEGGPGFLAMLNSGGQQARDFQKGLQGITGSTRQMAEIMLDTSGGSFTLLKSSVQLLDIEIGKKLNPTLRALALATMDWLNANISVISSGAGEWWQRLLIIVKDFGTSFQRVFEVVRPTLVKFRDDLVSVGARAADMFSRLPPWAQDTLKVAFALTAISSALTGIGGRIPIIGSLFMAVGGLINPVGLLRGAFTLLSSAVGIASGTIRAAFAVTTATAAKLAQQFATLGTAVGTSIVAAAESAAVALGPVIAPAQMLTIELEKLAVSAAESAAAMVPLVAETAAATVEMYALAPAVESLTLAQVMAGKSGYSLAPVAERTARAFRRFGDDANYSSEALLATSLHAKNWTTVAASTESSAMRAANAATSARLEYSLLGRAMAALSGIGRAIARPFVAIGNLFGSVAMGAVNLGAKLFSLSAWAGGLKIAVGALGGVLGFLTSPITLVVGALALLGSAVYVAMQRSSEARGLITGAFKGISDGAMALVNGAMKIFREAWDATKDDLTVIGTAVIKIGVGIWDAMKPVARLLGGTLLEALNFVVGSCKVLIKVVSTVVSLFTGDWRQAMLSLDGALASLIRGLGRFIWLLSHVPGFGWLKGAADGLDSYAAAMDGASAVTQKQIDKEKALIAAMREKERIIKDGDAAKDRARQQVMTEAEERAETARLRSAITTSSYIGDSATASKRQKELTEHLAKVKANENARAEEKASAEAAKLGMTSAEYATQQEEKKRAAEEAKQQAAAGKFEMTPISAMRVTNERGESRPLTAKQAADVAREQQAASPAIPSEGSDNKPGVRPLTAAEAARANKMARTATHEQSLSAVEQMKSELSHTLTPDSKTGAIDTQGAKTVLDNYRAVLGKMPGFTLDAFNKIDIQVRELLKQLATESSAELRKRLLSDIETVADAGEQIFATNAQQADAFAKKLRTASSADIAKDISDLAKLGDQLDEQALAAGAKLLDIRNLQKFEDNIRFALQRVAVAHGAERDQAIADLRETQEAYAEYYGKIVKTVDKSTQQIEKDGKDAAKQSVQDLAAQAKAEREARINGQGGPNQVVQQQGQGGQPQGQQGQGQQNQQGQQQQNPFAGMLLTGNSAEARRNRIKVWNAGFDPTQVIAQQQMAAQQQAWQAAQQQNQQGQGNQQGQQGQQQGQRQQPRFADLLAGGIAAMGGLQIGVVQQVIDSIKDPIKKLGAQIDNIKSTIAMMTQNFGSTDRENFMALQGLHKDLATLESRKQRAQRDERAAQRHAVSAGAKYMREQQLAAKGQVMAALRESGLDGMIKEIGAQGSINGAGQGMVVNFHGITDWRTALDKLDTEARRRGWNLANKRTLETRQVPG